MGVMGQKLRAIVERIRRETTGIAELDLARLNLKVGVALSRIAADIHDEASLVARAERAADEILSAGRSRRRS